MLPLLRRSRKALLLTSFALSVATPAWADPLMGDLDGNGIIDSQDEALLTQFYGAELGDSNYIASIDANSDGVVDALDLALFARNFGQSGGDIDTTPPELFVTLNDIPDDMNDLLVVPPDGFQITIQIDQPGGSVIDAGSLSITSDQPIGALPAAAELKPSFTTSALRADWQIPAGSELARTTHNLTVSVSDAAGNQSSEVYGFAVRDYPFSGQPLGNLQTVFLDFDRDRNGGTDIDFLEDLRSFGLSSTADPQIESQMRDWIVMEILVRAHAFFGRNPDGSPGPDAVNLQFESTDPGGLRSRLCVGGYSTLGSAYLGATILDKNNVNEFQDECPYGSLFGVFPQAIDDLWGSDPDYLGAFTSLHPGFGGTPIGEHVLDSIVLGVSFDPQTAAVAEMIRWSEINVGVEAFAQVIATAIAHETGHLLGLVAHGAAPGGLYGGTVSALQDHNVTPTGATPSGNFLMNQGASFSFEQMTGANGASLPTFRELSWAYLHDRVVLDSAVTGLYPAPQLTSVTPNSLDVSGGPAPITIEGDDFVGPLQAELVVGAATPSPLVGLVVVDPQTITGIVDPAFVITGTLYDVRVINTDGQSVTLPGGLQIQ